MTDISAVILYKTPDDVFIRAVASVSWCKEILLIGQQKGDLSVFSQECLEKIRWIEKKLKKDYAYLRNVGLQEARYDWVLFLDADEIISDTLAREIQNNAGKHGVSGYYMRRTDTFMGKTLRFGETANVLLLRLGRKDSGAWVRPVHEYWNISGKTDLLSSPIIHTPHATIDSFLEKIRIYTEIEADFRKKTGKSFSLIECLTYPIAKFIYGYFIRLGFLDGFAGLVMAYLMSIHSLAVRIQLYEQKTNKT